MIRDKRIIYLFFFVFIVSYYSTAINDLPGLSGDDAGYVIWAKSLLNGGGLDYTNEPHVRESGFVLFTLPVLLMPFVYISDNIAVYKIVSLLFSAFSILLFLNYIKARFKSEKLITASVLILIFNGMFFEYSHQIMAENIFIFFTLFSIIAAEKYEKTNNVFNWNLIFVLTLSIISYFTRAAGIPLIASIIIYFFLKSPKKAVIITILYLIFFLLFFGIKNFGKPAEKEKYSSIILMKSQYEPEAGLRSIGETLSDAGRKFFVYSLRLVPDMFFYPFFKNVKPSAVSIKFLVQACAGFLLTILILSGFFLRFKPFTPKNIIGQISVSDIYILLTAGMLLIWQIYSSRYLLPILPFLIFNIIYSFNMIADKKIVKYIFMIFITINIIAQFKLIYLERTNYIPGEWKEYYSTLNYLESNNLIKENVSVVCRKPLSYHLLSGYKLKTIGYPLTADTDEIRKFMKYNKINYIVRDNFFISGVDTAGKYLDPFLDKYSSELELLYSSNDGKTKLFKIVFFD